MISQERDNKVIDRIVILSTCAFGLVLLRNGPGLSESSNTVYRNLVFSTYWLFAIVAASTVSHSLRVNKWMFYFRLLVYLTILFISVLNGRIK